MNYIGLGKTLFTSSACLIAGTDSDPSVELVLTERITRKKGSGAWPEAAIQHLRSQPGFSEFEVAENRDVLDPVSFENQLNGGFPFFEHLDQAGLGSFTRHFNPALRFVTHHLCHAYAGILVSPFSKCVVLVIDGGGTQASDFPPQSREVLALGPADSKSGAYEEASVYLFDRDDGGRFKLECVAKDWQRFARSRTRRDFFSEGLGTLYEKSAEYIFNCKRSSGKVMGLAAFGQASEIGSRSEYLESLDWTRAFTGKSKAEWETSGNMPTYSEIAATVQKHFETSLLERISKIRQAFPAYERLMIVGGSALNCTFNAKLAESGIFDEIYIPPYPGDESIGLGAASYLYHSREDALWNPLPHEKQHGFFGPRSSVPEEKAIREVFRDFEIVRPESIERHAARILEEGHVIAWFQGRSESGPRALGNRSILARPDRPGLKDRLNRDVKFRESFRPYGCSCLHEKAHEYFDVPAGFNNPFMSFAPRIRGAYRDTLREVGHVDGTSRMQTVRETQNPRFHHLISEFGDKTGLYCLLNTSLNVMGEPIAETIGDVRRLLLETSVDRAGIGDFFVTKK